MFRCEIREAQAPFRTVEQERNLTIVGQLHSPNDYPLDEGHDKVCDDDDDDNEYPNDDPDGDDNTTDKELQNEFSEFRCQTVLFEMHQTFFCCRHQGGGKGEGSRFCGDQCCNSLLR